MNLKLAIAILIIAAFPLAIAQTSSVTPSLATVCCEKTDYGAWCQNSRAGSCDAGFRETPTSCEATSFCKPGCCYDTKEGICSENTAQKVCEQGEGVWADSASCNIPQCNLGCCVLDNQAAFVTLVRCKKLSGFFGLQTNFRTDITSETACIATAQAQDRGACVFEEQFTRTCKFTTKGECDNMKKSRGNATLTNITFHKDFLCTAEELGTNCARTTKTACIDGKDEIYFQDSCGNPANIYDSGKVNDAAYWRKIVAKKDSCGFGSGNINSASCGNCDYSAGSFCRRFESGKDSRRPSYGDFICRDLNCYNTQDGKDYKHGESWCIYDSETGKGKDLAGSRQFKHVCIAGEEIVEPCADFRSEVCIQSKISTDKGSFQQAGCRVNRWQDCVAQKSEKDCLNEDKRDCQWIKDVIGQDALAGGNSSSVVTKDKDGEDKVKKLKKHNVCVPDVPPGLKFYTSGEAESVCSQGNSICAVQYEKGLIGGKSAKVNSECLSSSWAKKRQEVCVALGDCSGSVSTCKDGKCEAKKGVWSVLQSGKFISGTGKIISELLGIKAEEKV